MAALASPPPIPDPGPSRPGGLPFHNDVGADEAMPRTSRATDSSPMHSLDLPSLMPLSHAHPLLLQQDFDVDAFLLSRIHIPLDELRAELRAYLAVLREELVQLINDDYEEFISLGTGLRGESERLTRLQRPLGSLRGEVEVRLSPLLCMYANSCAQVVRDVLKEHQNAVQAKLDERAALREEKALLDLLQRLFETLARAEALQDEVHGDNDSTAKGIARLAGEYTQLVYLRNKARGEGCKIAETVSPRIDVIRNRLSHDLSGILAGALEARDETQTKQCLKTYDLVEGWAEAEDVVRSSVRSFCAATITATALVVEQSPAVPETPSKVFERPNRLKDDPSLLAGIYNRVLAHVESYLPLITISHHVSQEFDFFSRVFWPEVCKAITDNLGNTIFAAGRPSELHKHYTTTHKFLGLFENYAPTPEAVVALRDSSAYATFERRWQLPVYFQLRWKEIVSTFESALSQPASVTSPTTKSTVFALSQSAATWDAFSSCWSTDIYLPELAHRFWRLSLQIVSRYDSWLTSSLATFNGEDDDDAALRFAAAAVADVDAFRARVAENALVSEHGDFPLALKTEAYADRIIGILQKQCAEPLKHVRGVTSQLRAAPPKTTAPSVFVPTLLKPLHAFFDSRPHLAAYKISWSSAVSQHVFGQYASILAQVNKTQDLLTKYRKTKKSGFSLFGSSGTASTDSADEDKRFTRQMVTDIEALAADAKGLGVNVDAIPSWAELKDVAERPAE